MSLSRIHSIWSDLRFRDSPRLFCVIFPFFSNFSPYFWQFLVIFLIFYRIFSIGVHFDPPFRENSIFRHFWPFSSIFPCIFQKKLRLFFARVVLSTPPAGVVRIKVIFLWFLPIFPIFLVECFAIFQSNMTFFRSWGRSRSDPPSHVRSLIFMHFVCLFFMHF